MDAQWLNAEHTIGNLIDPATNHVIVVEPGHPLWDGFAARQDIAPYVAPPAPALSGADIDRERDRRVQAGLTVTVAGYGDVALQGRDIDMRNLHGLATAAQLRIAGGAGATLTPFRDRNNEIHQLNQMQILDLWSQGAAFVSAVFQSAWALKDNPPIPANFADDEFWP